MKQFRYFKTRFFIKPSFIHAIALFAMVIDFVISLIPHEKVFLLSENTLSYVNIGLSLTYFCSILFFLFFLFFDSYEIENLSSSYYDNPNLTKNYSVNIARAIVDEKSFSYGFIHVQKKKDDVISEANFLNYTFILPLMFAWQSTFFFLSLEWSFLFYFIVIISLVLIFIVIIGEFISKKKFDKKGGIIIGHLLIGYYFFYLGKNVYVRTYGNEIIGSYWEKSEYRTKYYVILYNGSKEFKLPAQLYVKNSIETDVSSEGVLSTENTVYSNNRQIILEKVFLNARTILLFSDCDMNFEEVNFCWDQYGREWEVKLLNEKYFN